jgi:gliding motility associated protien GldN
MKLILKLMLLLGAIGPLNAQSSQAGFPMDDIVARTNIQQERFLPNPPLREADILWEKRIWRVIDTREKINLPFRYPKQPLFSILTQAVEAGKLTAYSTEDDQFSFPLSPDGVSQLLRSVDTVAIIEPEIYSETFQIVENEIDPQDIKRYRLKEVWYFDSRLSKLEVRILGIAPLKEYYDDNGNFMYEAPLFWLYFPECRKVLADQLAFNPWNNRPQMSWTDIFDMRMFSSYIIKDANVYDRRLEDYLAGTDRLKASERKAQEIFNMEQDAWQE